MFLLDADIRMRRGDFSGASANLRLEAARIADRHPDRAATMLLLAANSGSIGSRQPPPSPKCRPPSPSSRQESMTWCI